MSYRSWLKDVKHVGDLGQQLAPVAWNRVNGNKRELAQEANWLKAVNKPIPVSPPYSGFFGSQMHDSWVISQSRDDGRITIALDSIEGNVFCTQLGLWLDVEFPEPLMPVDLICHDVIYARWARHDDKTGWLKYSQPKFRTIDPSRTMSDSFGYDFFHEQAGRIQWIAQFRAYSKRSDWLKSDLFLMADCSHVTAQDHRQRALRNSLGERAETLWAEFFMQTEFDVWDQPRLFALLESVSERKGWTKSVLRHQLLQLTGASILEAYRHNVEAVKNSK